MWPQVVALVSLLLRYLWLVFVPQMPEDIFRSFSKAAQASNWLLVLYQILVMVHSPPHLDANRPDTYPIQSICDILFPTGAL